MSRTEKPVDSIVDPRFANELSYVRQIWLRTQRYYVSSKQALSVLML